MKPRGFELWHGLWRLRLDWDYFILIRGETDKGISYSAPKYGELWFASFYQPDGELASWRVSPDAEFTGTPAETRAKIRAWKRNLADHVAGRREMAYLKAIRDELLEE